MERDTLGPSVANSYRISGDIVDMTRPALPARAITLNAEPQNITVDLRRTAVVVVDMQNDFCAPGGWFDTLGVDLSGLRTIYPRIRAVTDSARSIGVPVIWLGFGTRADRANLAPITRYPFARVGGGKGLGDLLQGRGRTEPHRILAQGSWGAEVVPELGAQPGDLYVDKHRISGFWDTPLDSILRHRDIKTVAFLGVNSDECVFATLIDASFHGYDTVLIEDGCATSSPATCHEAALYKVRFCFGYTVTSQEWTQALQGVR
jgi:nicotinamidase-related amidase